MGLFLETEDGDILSPMSIDADGEIINGSGIPIYSGISISTLEDTIQKLSDENEELKIEMEEMECEIEDGKGTTP